MNHPDGYWNGVSNPRHPHHEDPADKFCQTTGEQYKYCTCEECHPPNPKSMHNRAKEAGLGGTAELIELSGWDAHQLKTMMDAQPALFDQYLVDCKALKDRKEKRVLGGVQ